MIPHGWIKFPPKVCWNPNNQYPRLQPYLEIMSLTEANELKWGHEGTLIQYNWCPDEKRTSGHRHGHTQRDDDHRKREPWHDASVSKGCQRLPGTHQTRRRQSRKRQERHLDLGLLDCLSARSWISVVSKLPGLWYFVRTALGNRYVISFHSYNHLRHGTYNSGREVMFFSLILPMWKLALRKVRTGTKSQTSYLGDAPGRSSLGCRRGCLVASELDL